MTAKAFADTNIVIYAEGTDVNKAQLATAILESGPIISSQVVTETISTLTRKYGFTLTEAHEVALSLLDLCEVVPVATDTIREAIRLVAQYQLSHWDSLIVAAERCSPAAKRCIRKTCNITKYSMSGCGFSIRS